MITDRTKRVSNCWLEAGLAAAHVIVLLGPCARCVRQCGRHGFIRVELVAPPRPARSWLDLAGTSPALTSIQTHLAHDPVNGEAPKRKIQDRELLRRFETIDTFPEAYRAFAKEMLDLLILRRRFRELSTLDVLKDSEPVAISLG